MYKFIKRTIRLDYVIIFCCILLIIVALLFLLSHLNIDINPFNIYFDTSTPDSLELALAQRGDYYGGIMGPLLSLAGVLLFWLSLNAQKAELKLQRDELKLTRKELGFQRAAMEKQNILFDQQRFETTFFNLHRARRELLTNMEYDEFDTVMEDDPDADHFMRIKRPKKEYSHTKKGLAALIKILSGYGSGLDTNNEELCLKFTKDVDENRYFSDVKPYIKTFELLMVYLQEAQIDNTKYIIFLFSQLSNTEKKVIDAYRGWGDKNIRKIIKKFF